MDLFTGLFQLVGLGNAIVLFIGAMIGWSVPQPAIAAKLTVTIKQFVADNVKVPSFMKSTFATTPKTEDEVEVVLEDTDNTDK